MSAIFHYLGPAFAVLLFSSVSVLGVFGSTRFHERQSTGRKQASPGLVVRGAVRIVASVASKRYHFRGPELQPYNLTQWRTLRNQMNNPHEARRAISFQKGPCGISSGLGREILPANNAVLEKNRQANSAQIALKMSAILLMSFIFHV